MMTVDQQNAHVINCSDDVTSQRKTSGERNPSYNDEPCAQSSRGKPEKRRAGRRRRPAPFFRLTFGLAWTRRTRVSRGDGAVEGAAE